MGFVLLSSCLPNIQKHKRVGNLSPRKLLQSTPLCNTSHLHTTWCSYSIAHIANIFYFRSSKHTCISQLACLSLNYSCKRTSQSSSTGNEHVLTLNFHAKQWPKGNEVQQESMGSQPPASGWHPSIPSLINSCSPSDSLAWEGDLTAQRNSHSCLHSHSAWPNDMLLATSKPYPIVYLVG